jgi:hypothetical protein
LIVGVVVETTDAAELLEGGGKTVFDVLMGAL